MKLEIFMSGLVVYRPLTNIFNQKKIVFYLHVFEEIKTQLYEVKAFWIIVTQKTEILYQGRHSVIYN